MPYRIPDGMNPDAVKREVQRRRDDAKTGAFPLTPAPTDGRVYYHAQQGFKMVSLGRIELPGGYLGTHLMRDESGRVGAVDEVMLVDTPDAVSDSDAAKRVARYIAHQPDDSAGAELHVMTATETLTYTLVYDKSRRGTPSGG